MLNFPPNVLEIIRLLENGGAKDVLVVGGFVRDLLLGIPSKDVDLEVYGLSYAQIRDILAPHFHVDLVGRAFGVIKVDNTIDVALPRRESKAGVGHKGFDVEAVVNLDPKEAFARRDYTINAIGMHKDGSFYDPYDGIGDIKRRILRATSPAFKDDPLRVLRGMQFASRLGFYMDAQTIQYCREVYNEFATLSEERVYEEWKKWALKGSHPDLGLDILLETGWIDAFPELATLVAGFPKSKSRCKSGAWLRTKKICREVARAIQTSNPQFTEDNQVILKFSALCCNFNARSTDASSETSYARSFLEKMKAPKRIVNAVEPLVARLPAVYDSTPTPSAVRRLALALAPANIRLWSTLALADSVARETYVGASFESSLHKNNDPLHLSQWLETAESLNLLETKPSPILQGKDLLELGLSPGPQMGVLLKEMFEEQLDGIFKTKESGVARIRRKLGL